MQLRHRYRGKAVENIALEYTIPVPEEEELVFFYRPAEVAAIIVENLLGLFLAAVVPGFATLEVLVEVVREKRAVKTVRARFRDDVHRR